MRSWLAIALMLGVQAAAPRGSLEPGTLPQSWTTGGSCPEQPPFRSHEYNSDFVILRQSGCTNFEKPFLYLIFGERAALLIDTGAQTADVGGAGPTVGGAVTPGGGGGVGPDGMNTDDGTVVAL